MFIEHQILTFPSIYVCTSLVHIKVELHNFIEKSDIHSYNTENLNKFANFHFKNVILKWLINKALFSVEDYFKIAVYDELEFLNVPIGFILLFKDNSKHYYY